jgi:hypothetical protein
MRTEAELQRQQQPASSAGWKHETRNLLTVSTKRSISPQSACLHRIGWLLGLCSHLTRGCGQLPLDGRLACKTGPLCQRGGSRGEARMHTTARQCIQWMHKNQPHALVCTVQPAGLSVWSAAGPPFLRAAGFQKTGSQQRAGRDSVAARGTPGTQMAALCAQKSGAPGCVFPRLITPLLVLVLCGDRISPPKVLCNAAAN